ncbi:unnamed protein product [Rotaria sp. Silwood2]|nr:unnamed protein product [Rotaria sp. Silwood2]CAF2968631.1 unnamed protein product [Rotaria sp. Silwood2]CAF3257725.1 unnamed protein product [Rotaria sp. Silwood2]CAF3964172.1 unnamed protein product [Rotaria sp. Silwood2]CAF4120340.1 unnamed protein product [Rotaria sp. Silwood2]
MSGIDLLYIDTAVVPNTIKQRKKSGTIYEWYAWSYFNIIFGCLIMGFIAMFFSFRTTKYKEADNNDKARLWSRITLLWNILATCAGFGLTFYALFKQ